MTRLHDDRAVLGDEASPDRLDRQAFADRIAKGIQCLPPNTAIVASVEGAWGIGKTSVLNLIKKAMTSWPELQQPIIVNFNPWLVGKAEQLAQAFIVQLAAAIELQDKAGIGAKAARQLLAYSKVFDALRLIPGADPWASMVKGVFEAVGGSVEKVSDLKSLDLEARRKAVTDSLAELNRRIVVFIDDLDRLPPQEVTEMIRLIKSVGEFPGVAYLVAFDAGYVEKALERQGIPDSGGYLDKIVQVRLTVPDTDSERLMILINEEYDALPEEAKASIPKTSERVQEVFFHGLRDILQTPRDIKRLFNRLYFIEPGCRGDVNLGDLMALEAIAIKAPSVYRHIRDDPEAYVGKPFYQSFVLDKPEDIVKQAAATRENVTANLPHGLRRSITRLLHELFPLTGPHAGWKQYSNTLGLISVPDRLAIAFSAGLPLQEASLNDAYALMKRPAERESILNDALARGRFPRLLEHLQALDNEEVQDLPGLAVALGTALDTPQSKEAEDNPQGDIWLTPSLYAWEFLKERLDICEINQAYPVLLALAKSTSSITLSTMALAELRKRLDMTGDSLPPLWARPDEWEQLLIPWHENIQTWIAAGKLNRLARGARVLHCFNEWFPEQFSKFVDSFLQSDWGTDCLFSSFGHTGTINGDPYIEFSPEKLEKYGGEKRLKEIARQRLSDTGLPIRLKACYTAILSGKAVYTLDARIAER